MRRGRIREDSHRERLAARCATNLRLSLSAHLSSRGPRNRQVGTGPTNARAGRKQREERREKLWCSLMTERRFKFKLHWQQA